MQNRTNGNLAVPQAIAQQRQAEAAAFAGIKNLHLQFSRDVFTRIVSQDYLLRRTAAAVRAVKEVDPYGTRELPEIAAEVAEEGGASFEVDCNGAAAFSVHAANVLLCHLGLVNEEGMPLVRVPGSDAAVGDQQPAESKIVLG